MLTVPCPPSPPLPLAAYRRSHAELLARDPAFARWLEESYIPIAGAWRY